MVRLRGMLRGGLFGSLFALAAVAVSGGASRPADAVPALAHRHRPMVIREVREGAVSAYNWSGYAVTGSAGSVTDVKGSWIVPAIQGNCPSTNQYASFWVGIDGFNSNTVEQIGTDSDCQNGVPTYYAWFEFYPHPMFLINTLAIHPGDVISAEVKYDPGTRQFTASIMNETTGQSFSTSTRVNRAQRSSAEWIAEAPSSAGGILPLADFGTAFYGFDNTTVASTNDAMVSRATGPIGAFGANVQTITMVSTSGATKAVPSNLSPDGTSFSDQWISSGP
jgi:Peptidase A4 family